MVTSPRHHQKLFLRLGVGIALVDGVTDQTGQQDYGYDQAVGQKGLEPEVEMAGPVGHAVQAHSYPLGFQQRGQIKAHGQAVEPRPVAPAHRPD